MRVNFENTLRKSKEFLVMIRELEEKDRIGMECKSGDLNRFLLWYVKQ